MVLDWREGCDAALSALEEGDIVTIMSERDIVENKYGNVFVESGYYTLREKDEETEEERIIIPLGMREEVCGKKLMVSKIINRKDGISYFNVDGFGWMFPISIIDPETVEKKEIKLSDSIESLFF